MMYIEFLGSVIIFVTAKRNRAYTKFMIAHIDNTFQDIGANTLSTISIINYKSHKTVKWCFFHLIRIRFPWDRFSKKDYADIDTFIFYGICVSKTIMVNSILRKFHDGIGAVHKILTDIFSVD